MYVDPSHAVVHLTMRRGHTELGVGSGILYDRNDRTYIVTAWHNATLRHSTTLRHLHSKGATPDNIIAYVSCRTYSDQFEGVMRRAFTIPLEDDTRTYYLQHPQTWPRVDVVAIPIDPSTEYPSEGRLATGESLTFTFPMRTAPREPSLGSDIFCIQHFERAARRSELDMSSYLGLSDELFVVGYPRGITDYTGQPVWKRATVATSPHAGWERQKKFLVDCASREGMSGAPAITFSRTGRLNSGSVMYLAGQPITLFHGIYVGRESSESLFEAQIGTIWLREVIDEVIDGAVQSSRSGDLELPIAEVDKAIAEAWPNSSDYAEMLLREESTVKHYFTHSIMERIAGRANPDDVLKRVLSIAEQKRATQN